MSTSTDENKKPSPRLTVDIGGEPRTFFMSFGLLNEVASLAGGPEGVPNFSFNAATSATLLELLLAGRDEEGQIIRTRGVPIIPLDLEPEIAEQIIDWAGAHVLDFFVRRFAKSAHLFATRAGKLAEAGSSLTSSTSSAGKTA